MTRKMSRPFRHFPAFPLAVMLLPLFLLGGGCSCTKEGPGEEFLEAEELQLIVDGRVVMTYAPLTCQVSYNHDRKTFRVHNDDMSRFYQLNCAALPYSQGQEIKADLRWSDGASITNRQGLTFRVEKVTEEGRFWLWCPQRKIAVSVQMFL